MTRHRFRVYVTGSGYVGIVFGPQHGPRLGYVGICLPLWRGTLLYLVGQIPKSCARRVFTDLRTSPSFEPEFHPHMRSEATLPPSVSVGVMSAASIAKPVGRVRIDSATSLWRAAEYGDLGRLKMLLDAGRDINAWCDDPSEKNTSRRSRLPSRVTNRCSPSAHVSHLTC